MAEARDYIEKIEEVSKVSSTKGAAAADPIVERVSPNKEHFDSLMKQDVVVAPPDDASKKASFIDQIRDLDKKVNDVSQASPDTILQKSRQVIAQIEEVKQKLAQPNVELKGSVQNLLHNKLSHIDESLKVALNRAGSEYAAPAVSTPTSQNPVERFLGFLTHGQNQLQKLSDEVNKMHLNKTEISPANMLAIQIKVGYVQQEMEFFTAVLNKALESTKTIMNVQV